MKVAQVLYQELDIGAVAITDRENCWLLLVATITIYRANHFHPGYTLKAIGENRRWFYADGNGVRTAVRRPQCKARLDADDPLRGENQRVMGANCTKRKTGCSAQLTALWERVLRGFIRLGWPGGMNGREALTDAVRIKLLRRR